MIEAAGLEIVFLRGCSPTLTNDNRIYYIGAMRRGDTAPGWLPVFGRS
jgi:hypothetical protein